MKWPDTDMKNNFLMTGFHIISHGERLREARMPFPTRQVKFLKPTEKKKRLTYIQNIHRSGE